MNAVAAGWRWLLASAVGVCGLACSPNAAGDLLLPNVSRPYAESPIAKSSLVAVQLNEFGEASGEGAFGLPIAATVLNDGRLVVADLYQCALIVIARPAGGVQDRFGGCGDGPGEFRQIRTVASDGDSLFVYDQGLGAIVVLEPAGGEARRLQIASGSPASGLSHLAVLDDSSLVAALEGPGRASVVVLDRSTGAPRATVVEASPIATSSEGVIRHLAACVGNTGGEQVIVAMNEFAFEGIGFDRLGGERFHFLTAVDLPPTRLNDGSWAPGPTSADVRCGDSVALFRMTTPGPTEISGGGMTVRAGEILLEGRGYDGELMFRETIVDQSSLLRGSLGAFRGDTLFVLTHSVRAFPIVGEYVMKKP